jgi:serine/threonine-protein phosphatase PP1 catalytic subunit
LSVSIDLDFSWEEKNNFSLFHFFLHFHYIDSIENGCDESEAPWQCPICKKKTPIDDFVFEPLFQRLLDTTSDAIMRARVDTIADTFKVVSAAQEAQLVVDLLFPGAASAAVSPGLKKFASSSATDSGSEDSSSSALSSRSRLKVGSTTVVDYAQAVTLIDSAAALFKLDEMCRKVKAPVCVIGDLHGQFEDLISMMSNGGMPPRTSYVFLGDYIDRGRRSLDTILLLFALKILYPDYITLLRGNHEEASICRVYGFYDECKRVYNARLWKRFCGAFDWLPIAALVDDAVLCIHGGISPQLHNMELLGKISRPCAVPQDGILCDLLWSDPEASIDMWQPNEDRGISFQFGAKALKVFMQQNDLQLVVRAHQVVQDGYEFFGDRMLVTVFSARTYGGEFDNDAAMMRIDEALKCSFFVRKGSGDDEFSESDSGTSSRSAERKKSKKVKKIHVTKATKDVVTAKDTLVSKILKKSSKKSKAKPAADDDDDEES